MLLGFQAKLYYVLAGIGGTPSWVEITNATTVTVPRKVTSKTVTPRGMNGVEGNVAGLFQLGAQFKIPYVSQTDTVYLALLNAWATRAVIGMAAMSGDIATTGSEGVWCDVQITDMSKDEPEDGGPVMVNVEFKPAISSNAAVPKKIIP